MGVETIEFIQCLFPAGKRVPVTIARPSDVARKYRELIDKGFKFEIENLAGKVWMSCVKHDDDMGVDEFCANGEEVILHVDTLIENAHQKFIRGNA